MKNDFLSEEHRLALDNARAYLSERKSRLGVQEVRAQVDEYLYKFQMFYSASLLLVDKSASDVAFSNQFMTLVHEYSSPERVDIAGKAFVQYVYDAFLKPSALDDLLFEDETLN